MRQPGEPTVEEILESIKQVIAREDRSSGARAIRAGAITGEDNAIEQGAGEQGAGEQGAGEQGAGGQDTVLDLAQHDFARTGEQPSPLVTEGASSSMRGSLDALAGIAARSAPEPVAGGASAIEALVRELLRPALAEWLDRNLPAIVERMVATEIARITARRD